MFRGPPRSKASASTQCQKCLKRGHYSYECNVTAQERPYKSRPSRTQQLLNPDLKPKLTTDVPNELLRKKGVADELLAKKEEERGRKDSQRVGKSSRKHTRSYSSDSVSTISTNRSPSRSPPPKHTERNGKPSSRRGGTLRKRSRRSISADSYSSNERGLERNTRRRMSSFSPANRGRRRDRSRSSRMDVSNDPHTRQRNGRRHLSHSRSRSAVRGRRGSRSRSKDVKRRSLSRSRSRSSGRMDTSDDQKPAASGGRFLAKPSRNRLESRSPSRSPRGPRRRSPFMNARSPSPYSRRAARRSPSPFKAQNGGGRGRNGAFDSRGGRFDERPAETNARSERPAPPQPSKERSLSPFSKRVALTKAMQAGR